MRFEIITLFPETFTGFLQTSLIGKAIASGKITTHLHNIRDFTTGKHKQADDRPYGGGPGMVLMADPIYKTIEHIKKRCKIPKTKPGIIALAPRGNRLTPKLAKTLSKQKQLVLLCGHYEGFDERIFKYVDQEISIGDYVTQGGETPAMVLIEAISRFIPGVIKERASVKEDSFSIGVKALLCAFQQEKSAKQSFDPAALLLDWPHYTRPRAWRKISVPKILLSGHTKKIEQWRLDQALKATQKRRPDLLKK
ncbi:tRNA (guanosine(37)-N1)-methyltransferase TrmD [Elusimicrobiota bacterium]